MFVGVGWRGAHCIYNHGIETNHLFVWAFDSLSLLANLFILWSVLKIHIICQ